MMKEPGRVIKAEEGEVTIEVRPPETCTKCCACRAARVQYITITGEKAKGLKSGDRVEVEVNTSPMLKVYALFYGIPLAAFMASIFLLYLLSKSPLISLAGAVISVAVTYVLIGSYAKKRHDLYPNICLKEK